MLFVLALSLGATALFLRSAVAIAVIGLMIVAVFFGASVLSSTGFHMLPLLIAIAGYNLGIAGGFVAIMTIQRWRTV